MKMNLMGFLADTGVQPYVVNKSYPCKFVLPTLDYLVQTNIVVVKTYDWYRKKGNEAAGGENMRLSEFHFRNLGGANQKAIREFLKK
jgi:hypothetical protein